MTSGVVASEMPVAAEPVQRLLAVARRALAAREAMLVEAGAASAAPGATLTAEVDLPSAPVTLVAVSDDAARRWSDEDAALLRDIAAAIGDRLRLDEDHRRLRTVIDHVPGLVFEQIKTGDADTRRTFLGGGEPALAAALDRLAGDRATAADGDERVRAAWNEGIETERDLDVTLRVDDADAGSRWIRSRAVVRRDADGAAVWTGFCCDVAGPAAERDTPAAVATATEAPPVDPAAGATDAPATPRILLADDLDLNRKLICDMLSLDGYDVDSVADGAAAVEAVKNRSYDLVLMDMIMPGMDGIDATRAIRALPAPTCDVPIVALTAHSFREQLDDCLHAGMNATLTKPMSFEALTSAVSLWARGRRAA